MRPQQIKFELEGWGVSVLSPVEDINDIVSAVSDITTEAIAGVDNISVKILKKFLDIRELVSNVPRHSAKAAADEAWE